MSGPPEIWIDARIAPRMNTEPDPDVTADGVDQLRYVSAERLAELVRSAAGGTEFFIQINLVAGGIMFALTNYGRLFRQNVDVGVWEMVDVPDFDEARDT